MAAPVKPGMQVGALPPDLAGATLFRILRGLLSPRELVCSSATGHSQQAILLKPCKGPPETGILCHSHLTGEGSEALTEPATVLWEVELRGRPGNVGCPSVPPAAAGVRVVKGSCPERKPEPSAGLSVVGWLSLGENDSRYAGTCAGGSP